MLATVKRHAARATQLMVKIPLWSDTIHLQFLGNEESAASALGAKGFDQICTGDLRPLHGASAHFSARAKAF